MTFTVVALGILATGGWMLARSSLFALERIEVAGTKALSRNDVVNASGLRPGANMLSLDMDTVEKRIARLPLVRTVEVSKPEPSRIRIVVTERTPAFVLETIHGLWLLDGEAVVLGASPTVATGLPTIRSLPTQPTTAGRRVGSEDVESALKLWSMLSSSLREGPPVIEIADGGFTFLRPDLEIRFGTFDRIDQKIEALDLVVERARAARENLRAIDVRSPGRPAALAG